MSGYVVYLDVLLLLNFCMDFLLLWTAGRTLRISTPLWRLLSAAGLGGAYASCMVLELPRWLWSPPAAVAASTCSRARKLSRFQTRRSAV